MTFRWNVRSLVLLAAVALVATAGQIPGSGPNSVRLGYDGSVAPVRLRVRLRHLDRRLPGDRGS